MNSKNKFFHQIICLCRKKKLKGKKLSPCLSWSQIRYSVSGRWENLLKGYIRRWKSTSWGSSWASKNNVLDHPPTEPCNKNALPKAIPSVKLCCNIYIYSVWAQLEIIWHFCTQHPWIALNQSAMNIKLNYNKLTTPSEKRFRYPKTKFDWDAVSLVEDCWIAELFIAFESLPSTAVPLLVLTRCKMKIHRNQIFFTKNLSCNIHIIFQQVVFEAILINKKLIH